MRTLLLTLAVAGCATNPHLRTAPPPHALATSAPFDSAYASVRAALALERLELDAAAPTDSTVLSTTFIVRRGGMGEAEVRLRLRLQPDGVPSDARAGTLLRIDGTARDLKRMLVMSTEDARSPRLSREPHPIQDNDRDALERIARLLDRLRVAGWSSVPSP